MAIAATLDRAKWRLRNRGRSASAPSDPRLAPLVETLRRDGIVLSDAVTVLGDGDLYDRAAARAQELYERPRERGDAAAGSKESFKTKLAAGSFDADDPFVEIALHPAVLAVANGYLRLRSTLRALELWLTEPTPGPAIQTQLWHRDADDLLNVKLFLYFSDVTRAAGPFTYAPRTHPLGDRRELPEHDTEWRTTDEQMARIVPDGEWLVCEGGPGTAVFADTCGYHKQLKPESAERLMLVAHYVSGTPYVPHALELRGVDAGALTDDQHVAVFDRPRA
ncbi:MAG: phytanoyl-CoA dioxygenase family protein [Actinomycetota bacterium]|nr:phytanoyl-CoA dioxygenase family protein [Actinomycetota bacterium]